MKKAQMGESIGDKLAAKTAERKTKGASLREGQVKRIVRATNDNPERGLKVRKRIIKRANAKAEAEPMMKHGGMKKAENGKTAFGMLSVKAGVDKNPNPTAADRIAGAKGLAKSGKKVVKKASYGKMMKGGGKCKNGC